MRARRVGTRIGRDRLQHRMMHVYRQRLGYDVGHNRLIDSLELVRRQHSIQLPIGPVHRVLEERQRVRVEQVVRRGEDLEPLGAVVQTGVDKVELAVGKVDALGGDVEGQAVRPVDLGVDDGQARGAVHADALDTGILAPVGPEEPAGTGARVEAHATGLGDVFLDEDHAVAAVLLSHLDGVELGVEPVEVLADPVVGQAFDEV